MKEKTQVTWDDLTEWQQTSFAVRLIRETLGITDEYLEHTYLGDETPFDSGLIDWKRVDEEFLKRKNKKKGKKNDRMEGERNN